MSFKTSYILFGILAVLLLVLGIALYFDPLPKELSDYVLPSAHRDEEPFDWQSIDHVEIERDGKKYVFVKDEKKERWYIEKPFQAEAYRFNIEQLIQQILGAQREKKAELPGLDQLGLAPPKSTFTLKKGDEQTFTLNVGNERPGENNAAIYVTSSDRGEEPMAVAKSSISTVQLPLVAYRDRDLLSASSSDLETIEISKTTGDSQEGTAVRLVKKDSTRWYYTQPIEAEANTADASTVTPAGQPPNGMNSLLTDLTNMKVSFTSENENDFVAFNISRDKLSTYHLSEADPILRVEIKRSEKDDSSSTRVLLIGITEKANEEPAQYYARLEGQMDIVKLDASNIDPLIELLKDPEALRDRHLFRLEAGETPNVIHIQNEHGLLEFYKPDRDRPWVLYRGDVQYEVDQQRISGLIALLEQDNQVASFIDSDSANEEELGLKEPTAVLSLWVNGIEKDEKEDPTSKKKPTIKDADKPKVKLTFGEWEKTKDVVVVKRKVLDAQTVLVRAKEIIFERVNDGALVYLDRKLPQYNPGAFDSTLAVTKVELRPPGQEAIVIKRVEKPKEEPKQGEVPPLSTPDWIIEAPASLKGRQADDLWLKGILDRLHRMSVVRYVTDKPTEADLKGEYGLQPPVAKVLVTTTRDEKSSTYEFDFGKEVEMTGVYGKQGGAFDGSVVYIVEKSVVEEMKNDPVDRQIFDFDPEKVREITFTGWRSQTITKLPFVLALKSDDGAEWTVAKGKVGFQLDSAKLRSFVNQLSKLHALDYIAHNENPRKAYETDPTAGGLQIQIKLEGEEKPLELRIGKKVDDKGYIVTTPSGPKDIFHVASFLFDGPKSKPDEFAKDEKKPEE